MAIGEIKNNFDERSRLTAEEECFVEKNKLTLTVIFVAIAFIVLGIQIMPYVYGGVEGHSHTGGGGCAWPNHCDGVQNF